MLQYNNTVEAPRKRADKAHMAHAVVVAIHVVCCGLPAAFALFGAALGMLALGSGVNQVHAFLHGYEGVVLAVSAVLVTVGGAAEWLGRRSRKGFPVLFAVSVACLFVNVAVVAGHRAFTPTAHAETLAGH